MIQYVLLQPQLLVDLCANRVGHGTPKMSQQMISWGNYMGHCRIEPRKEFYTCHSLYKNFRQSEQTLCYMPRKDRKMKGKGGKQKQKEIVSLL